VGLEGVFGVLELLPVLGDLGEVSGGLKPMK